MAQLFDRWDPEDSFGFNKGYSYNADTRAFLPGGGNFVKYNNSNKAAGNIVDHVYWDPTTSTVYYKHPDTGQYTLAAVGDLDVSGGVFSYLSDDQLDQIALRINSDVNYERNNLRRQLREANNLLTPGILNIPTPTPESPESPDSIQLKEYEKRKMDANILLQKMLKEDPDTTPELDNTIYYKYGPNEFDLKYYIHNLGSNLLNYLNSQDWSLAQKNAFMNSYNNYKTALQELLDTNSGRFSTDDAGNIIDTNNLLNTSDGALIMDEYGNIYNSLDEIPKKSLRKSAIEFSPNQEVADYLNTIGQAIVGSGKTRKSSSKFDGNFDLNKQGFVNYWLSKVNPAGGSPDIDPYLALDPTGPDGKRERTNRTKYLAHLLTSYLNKIKNSLSNFEGTAFKTKDAYIKKVQEAIDNLNNGWDTTDPASLLAIGITPDFYTTLMTDLANPLMSDEELSAEREKRKADAASAHIDKVQQIYNAFASSPNTHTENNPVRVIKDSRYNPKSEGGLTRIQTALANLGLPVTDRENCINSVDALWDQIKYTLRSGEQNININGKLININDILPVILPMLLEVAFSEPDASGVRYHNDPNNDLQQGAILCYKDGRLYFDFIENHKNSAAWQRLKAEFEKNYVVPNSDKPKHSFDKLGGVLRKLQEGGNINPEEFDPETLAQLQQLSEMTKLPTASLEENTGEHTAGELLADAIFGPREAAAKAKGLSLERYNQKLRTPNGLPDAFNPNNGIWKTEDYIRLGAIAADIASLVMDPVTGAVTNVGSTATNFLADWADNSVTATEMWKNLGMNLGMDALSIVPIVGDAAGTGSKLVKSVKTIAPKLMYGLTAWGVLGTVKNGSNIMESLGKVMSDDKLTVGDWQNIAQAITAVAGVNGAVKAGVAKKIAKNRALEPEAIGLGLKDKTGKVLDYIFRGDKAKELKQLIAEGDISKVNAKIKDLEGFADFEINTNLSSKPLSTRLPVGRVAGADGTKHWETRNPFSIERTMDTFEIFDASKLKGGYASRNLLNTSRLNAVEAQNIFGNEHLKTKAEVDVIVDAKIKEDAADAIAQTERRKAAIERTLKKIDGVKDADGNFIEDGVAETLRKTEAARGTVDAEITRTKVELDDLTTKNLQALLNLGSPDLAAETAKLQNKRARPAKIDEEILNTQDNLANKIDKINANSSLTKAEKAKLKANARAKANVKINQLQREKVRIQNDLTNNLDRYNKLELLASEFKRLEDLALRLDPNYAGSLALQKAKLDAAIAAHSTELSELRNRLEVLYGRQNNSTGTKNSRAKQKLLDLINSGPYNVEWAPGRNREVTDIKDIITNMNLLKKGGRLQFLQAGNKFKDRKVGNVTYNRPIDWYDDYVTEEGSDAWTPEFKQVFGRIKTQADVDEINNFQNNTYRKDFAIGSTNPQSGHGAWLPEKEAAYTHQAEYDKLAHEGNLRFTRGTLLGRLPGAMTDDSEAGGWKDGRAGTMTWLRHYGDNIAHVDKINNAGVLGEGIEAFWNPETQMVNFRVKPSKTSQNNSDQTPIPQSPTNPGSNPELIGLLTSTASYSQDPELLSVPSNPNPSVPVKTSRTRNSGKPSILNTQWNLNGMLPSLMDTFRFLLLNRGNKRSADIAKKGIIPYYLTPKNDNVFIYGDNEALAYGEKTKANLISTGYNHTLTSDGAQQMAFIKDLHLKGLGAADAGKRLDSEMRRTTQQMDLAQRKENHNNEYMVAAQNKLSGIKAIQDKNAIDHALNAQRVNDLDLFLQNIVHKGETARLENKALSDAKLESDITLAVLKDPNKYGANLSPLELSVYNRAMAGVRPHTMSLNDLSLLTVANRKIALATKNQYYSSKGVRSNPWTADANKITRTARTFTPNLVEISKDGSKLTIAKIRNKAKNADRFSKSIQKQIESLDKKLDRIARSMHSLPKSEVVKPK